MNTQHPKLLVIGYVWPEPATTAAGGRMMQLLQVFLGEGYKVTFVSTASKTSYSQDLESFGITMGTILLNDSSFDVFVQELQPQIVVFDRFMVEEQFGWRVANAAPNAIRILNTEDLHSLRKSREVCHKRKQGFTEDHWLQEDITKREVASIYRCDLSILVSTFEMEWLQKTVSVPSELLYHLPFLLDEITGTHQGQWPSFSERKDFICFGNGKHAPNVDAVRYLKNDIWPLIREQLGHANLHIYGAYLPQQLVEMHNPKEGFLIKGWVSNLDRELQQNRISLAPLRFGAGIKGKLTQSMQNGTPSVTTPIGIEGMHKSMPWAGEVAADPEDFAQKAVTLYQNEVKWSKKQGRGVQICNQLYAKVELGKAFFNHLKNLCGNINGHRKKNFTGQLLQHQSMASTKYMGKWIEEKNKEK